MLEQYGVVIMLIRCGKTSIQVYQTAQLLSCQKTCLKIMSASQINNFEREGISPSHLIDKVAMHDD